MRQLQTSISCTIKPTLVQVVMQPLTKHAPGAAVTGFKKTSRGGGIPGVICFLIIDGVCVGSENSFSRHAPQEQDKGRCAFAQVIVIALLLQ